MRRRVSICLAMIVSGAGCSSQLVHQDGCESGADCNVSTGGKPTTGGSPSTGGVGEPAAGGSRLPAPWSPEDASALRDASAAPACSRDADCGAGEFCEEKRVTVGVPSYPFFVSRTVRECTEGAGAGLVRCEQASLGVPSAGASSTPTVDLCEVASGEFCCGAPPLGADGGSAGGGIVLHACVTSSQSVHCVEARYCDGDSDCRDGETCHEIEGTAGVSVRACRGPFLDGGVPIPDASFD